MNWLTNNEEASFQAWRKLEADTEFIEASRVLNRHVITDENFQPRIFSGVVDRPLGPGRWSVLVEGMGRRVDLVASYFPNIDVARGRTVRDFSIAFNYRGPLADPVSSGRRRR